MGWGRLLELCVWHPASTVITIVSSEIATNPYRTNMGTPCLYVLSFSLGKVPGH